MIFLKNLFLFTAILAGILMLVALLQISAILVVESKDPDLEKADLIVVFPGGKERVTAGLALAESGYGANLSVINKTAASLQKSVDKQKITAEVQLITGDESRSTFEDIVKTSGIIRQNQFKSLILVTSSYHIPRSMFLLETFLKTSGMRVKVQYYPVNPNKNHNRTRKLKTYYNELVKLWGSSVEMACYGLTKKLPADIKGFNRAIDFFRTYLLFKI